MYSCTQEKKSSYPKIWTRLRILVEILQGSHFDMTTFNILTYALSLSVSVFPLWLILYKISISSLSVIWEGHSALASLSRSHTTWPDFPILHQILTRISFSNFKLCWVPLTSLKHAWFYLCFELIRITIHVSNPFLPISSEFGL